ncbi:unnamed protein product [Notodromas monacha]|uniref:Uncharacterized protein n=1 Tax=Notodromas monacha TaxID=399045 RepID=A0A7R9BKL6_9CRUS|nr:unnamed protein product [Notodromas monacha]CAG0917212.1 unnamed protein product [Notodromas monacha]
MAYPEGMETSHLNRKRGVHLLLRSGGSAGAGNPGSTFVVTKPTVMKPVGNSLVLSPKEPPPDTILLSPQQMTDRGIGVMRDQQQEKLANNNNNNNIDDYEEEEQQKKHHMQQLEEREEEMDECAAAMVLMRLSCSPRSPGWVTNSRELEGSSWSDRLSPSSTASSSGIASYPDGTPSPPLPKEYSPAELDDDFEDSPKNSEDH